MSKRPIGRDLTNMKVINDKLYLLNPNTKELKPLGTMSRYGYLKFTLNRHNYKVHEVIWGLSNPDSYHLLERGWEVYHKDGRMTNNELSNLDIRPIDGTTSILPISRAIRYDKNRGSYYFLWRGVKGSFKDTFEEALDDFREWDKDEFLDIRQNTKYKRISQA